TLLTAIGIGHGHTGHGDDLGTNEIQTIVVELLLRQILSREGQLEDGHTRRAIGKNEWRRRSSRQLPELGLRNSCNLGNALLNVCGRLEEHFNNSNSIERLRLDVFDVVDGGRNISLSGGNDPLAYLLCVDIVIVPDDVDDGC